MLRKITKSIKGIFTEKEDTWILRQIKKNPKSATKLTVEVKKYCHKTVNPEAVRRIASRNKYNGRVVKRKPLIVERNQKKRRTFARQHVMKDMDFWKRVIFCDKSLFLLL